MFPFLDHGMGLVIFSNGCVDLFETLLIGYVVFVQNVQYPLEASCLKSVSNTWIEQDDLLTARTSLNPDGLEQNGL